jgi:hypothetical protein
MLKAIFPRITALASHIVPRRAKVLVTRSASRKTSEPDVVVNPEHVPDYGVFVWSE